MIKSVVECKEQVGDPVDPLVEERSLSWERQIYIVGNYGLELKLNNVPLTASSDISQKSIEKYLSRFLGNRKWCLKHCFGPSAARHGASGRLLLPWPTAAAREAVARPNRRCTSGQVTPAVMPDILHLDGDAGLVAGVGQLVLGGLEGEGLYHSRCSWRTTWTNMKPPSPITRLLASRSGSP
jgi:hypothetical protein